MLNISNVKYSYGKKLILNDVSLKLDGNKCIAILGKNGCGKSTFLSLIAGSLKTKSGTITTDLNEKIGYVPQENPLINELTGFDNINLWFKGNRKNLNNVLSSPIIQNLGIDSFIKVPVKKMSGGMKRKISIAIGIINSPKYLILDEPTAALDIPSKYEIKQYLKEYKEAGNGIIFSTHDEMELEIADEIYIISNGKLIKINNTIKGDELAKLL